MNVELFVLGLVTSEPSLPWIGIGAAVAFGQVSGKLLHYLAARGIIELPSLLSARWCRGRRTHTAAPGRERRRQCTTRLGRKSVAEGRGGGVGVRAAVRAGE